MRLWRVAASTRTYAADDITRNKRRAAPSVSPPLGGRTTYVVGLGALSGSGAAVRPGRWNDHGQKVVYCAQTPSLAVLETAAHVDSGGLPLNRFLVAIEVPDDVWARRDHLDLATLDPSWSAIPAGLASVQAGAKWLVSMRTALLLVPSVIVHEESAVLINPAHVDAAGITARVVRKFEYDLLFRR